MKRILLFSIVAIVSSNVASLALAQYNPASAGLKEEPTLNAIQFGIDDYSSPSNSGQPDLSTAKSISDPQAFSYRSPTQSNNPVKSIVTDSNRPKPSSQYPTSTKAQDAVPATDSLAPTPAPAESATPYFGPTAYGHSGYSTNLLANFMSQQWCVDGLWDGYAAERAKECARQQERISGARRFRLWGWGLGCGLHGCGHDNCPQPEASCGSNSDCAAATPINRYKLPDNAGSLPQNSFEQVPQDYVRYQNPNTPNANPPTSIELIENTILISTEKSPTGLIATPASANGVNYNATSRPPVGQYR